MSTANSPNQETKPNLGRILDCDVLVAGASTAGAAAAFYMAAAGLKVAVIEKQALPLHNPCGCFVSPGSLRELKKMGIADQPLFGQVNRVDGATIYLNGKEVNRGAFPEVEYMPMHALVFPNKTLDGLILEAAQAAGVAVQDETRLVNYIVEKDWVTVAAEHQGEIQTICARLLIGADGANSTVARILKGAEWAQTQRALVARAYFEGVEGSPNEANAYFSGDCLPGYAWLFPSAAGEANVGVGVAYGEPVPENPDILLKKLIEKDEGLNQRLKNARMKSEIEVAALNLYDSQMPLVGDRVMLIGLAAGLVNPYNGEGIQLGLLSAKWAAATAKWCMQNHNFTTLMLNGYPRRLNYELGGGFKVSALIMGLLRNRNLNDTWLQWINYMGQRTRSDPKYRHLISAVLSGMIFPSEQQAFEAFAGSLQEAAMEKGANMFTTQDPKQPESTLNDWRVNREAVQYVAQNPIGALLWGVEAVTKATEVAASFSKQIIKDTQKDANQQQGQ